VCVCVCVYRDLANSIWQPATDMPSTPSAA